MNKSWEVEYPAVLGKVLAEIRKDRKINQKKVADAVGIGVPTWSKIENGESSISAEQLRAASMFLGTSSSKVLALVEEAIERLPEKGIFVSEPGPRAIGDETTKIKGDHVRGIALTGVAAASTVALSGVTGGTAVGVIGTVGAVMGATAISTAAPIIITGAVLGKIIGSVIDIKSLWKNKI